MFRVFSALFSGVVEYFITQEWSPFRAALTAIAAYLTLIGLDKATTWFRPRNPNAGSPRTPKEMMAEVKGKTDLAANEISKRHSGRSLRFSGYISDIIDDPSFTLVFCESKKGDRWACSFCRKKWRRKLSTYNQGDKIEGIGIITSVSSHSVSLDKCRLEEP